MDRFLMPVAIVLIAFQQACGGAAPQSLAATASSSDAVTDSEPGAGLAPGRYSLELSASCSGTPVEGVLTLAPIARSEVPPHALGERAAEGDSRPLLWGQTDVSVEGFETCLGGSPESRRDPIHESVLVQVLEWEGQPKRQVLLVSTGMGRSAPGGTAVTGGIALWVESARGGQASGAWSHWQLTGERRGRWVAKRLPDAAPVLSTSR